MIELNKRLSGEPEIDAPPALALVLHLDYLHPAGFPGIVKMAPAAGASVECGFLANLDYPELVNVGGQLVLQLEQ